MILKRIEASSLDLALAKVEKECGSNALVFDTQRTKSGYIVVAGKQAKVNSSKAELTPSNRRWTKGFAPIAQKAEQFGLAPSILAAVEKALIGTKVHLGRAGDPAIPSMSAKVLRSLIHTNDLDQPEFRVTALVGPTGVGKTTTLAKLAARAKRELGQSIAIISLDTYRVAAVEQLRAYADMLDAPFDVAFTPLDLRRALMQHAEVDRIFIDTTGRSPFDNESLSSLAGSLGNSEPATVLCLPAGLRRCDAESTLSSFAGLKPQSMIITKWDETHVPGETLSLAIEKELPLSFITVGQEVPEDIVTADAGALAANALCMDEQVAEAVL